MFRKTKFAKAADCPTCETIEHGRPDEFHVCKSCSRCSYGWFEDIYDKPYSYCPNCGAKVVVSDYQEGGRYCEITPKRGAK